jgi:hypothetical protein
MSIKNIMLYIIQIPKNKNHQILVNQISFLLLGGCANATRPRRTSCANVDFTAIAETISRLPT